MDECKYCEIVKQKNNLLYEDEQLIAIVPEKPIAKGHVQIISKKHHNNLQEIEDKEIEHLLYSASFAASSLFENLEAHGTNIIANSGSIIKKGGHFHADVIARKTGDNLNFLWKPKKLPEEEMKQAQGKIKDKCDMIGVGKKEKEVIDLDRKPEKLESAEEKTSEEMKEAEGKGAEGTKEEEKREEKKELPSEEEQRYKKAEKEEEEKKKRESKEEKESYLIKQLRRVP